MAWDDYIDTEIIYNPGYILMTAGAELALIIGFRAQSIWNQGSTTSIWTMIMTLILIPIASYFITMHRMNH